MKIIEVMGMPRFIEVIIEISYLLVLFSLIISMLISMQKDRKSNIIRNVTVPYTYEILGFYIGVVVYNTCNIVSVFTQSYISETNFVITKLTAFIYYVTGSFFTLLSLYILREKIIKKTSSKVSIYVTNFFAALQFFLLILLILTPFTGIIYHFENYKYVRSFGYYIWFYVTLITFIHIGIAFIVYQKYADKLLKKILITLVTIPIFAFVMDFFTDDLDLNNISVSVVSLVIFFFYENNRTSYLASTLREIDDLQTKLMISQIQPHFLFNSLTAIIYYADKDAVKTKEALTWFSKYLQNNIESINNEEPISFMDELSHVKAYLYLEKLRFEDDLDIEYNLADTDFSLPVLSLQPMVENAVRHGIRKKPDSKGKVLISTKKDEKYHIIKIEDDGVGFDTTRIESFDDSHVGINNVKKRINMQVNGELLFSSTLGKGTTCTIKIPL